jgi:hypothetical protein
MNNALSGFSSFPLKANSRTSPILHCARWLHFVLLHLLLTSWTNESGPCNLVSKALEMKITAAGNENLTLPACLPAFLSCIVTLSAKYPLNCHWTAAALHHGRGCYFCTGNLPTLRLWSFLFWVGRGRASDSGRLPSSRYRLQYRGIETDRIHFR